MHVRVRCFGKPDAVVAVVSKLTKIEEFRRIIHDKINVAPEFQRLFYGGKLLQDGFTFHDYGVKLNDVIQVMVVTEINESAKDNTKDTKQDDIKKEEKHDNKVEYIDAESVLYAIGDLIDTKDPEEGAWFEGKIVRIVHDPATSITTNESKSGTDNVSNTIDNDLENQPPKITNGDSKQKKGIAKFFKKSPKKANKVKDDLLNHKTTDTNLLYVVKLINREDQTLFYCKLPEIRPRSRNVIDVKDLKVGQKVMVNYNLNNPREKGYWYDFKISEIKKRRTIYELIGTVYFGSEGIPLNDTTVFLHDNVYAIEEVVPLSQRTEEYKKMMITEPKKRSQPLNCLECRDNENVMCKECGCFLCSGKQNPEKIILCDECNKGFHLTCVSPPLTEVPEEDWYCPSCKRDPNDVIAPGAAKQTKKASTKSNRDWGRGMACVGKTKTCAMPSTHFGPIPGIDVGMCWRFRIQVSEVGVHRPPVSGIHGRDSDGAYSIVLSGGYEDDVDNGNEFTYTGSGGRDLSGNKRTAEQSCDQTLTRQNKALARNCAVKQISENGGDAGENWCEGKPVRVVRSYKMLKHFPKYAPKEGLRYDGIYKVVKYYPEKGLSGYRVWKYLLRRDDPSPAPWEPGAKRYPIIYPEGYLEAEAEKEALKEKTNKGKGRKVTAKKPASEDSTSESEGSPTKETKNKGKEDETSPNVSPKSSKKPKAKNQNTISEMFTKSPSQALKPILTKEQIEAIKNDTMDAELLKGCIYVRGTQVKYPEGYLEADAEEDLEEKTGKGKMAKSSQKRKLEPTDSDSEDSSPSKIATNIGRKRRASTRLSSKSSKKPKGKNQNTISDMLKKSPAQAREAENPEQMEAIKADTLNAKLWTECLDVCKTQGKKEFVERVTELFLCIICQDVAVSPVTTPCLHNFCKACLKLAFKSTGPACPACRNSLAKYDPEPNEQLKTALRSILPGYDAGKK